MTDFLTSILIFFGYWIIEVRMRHVSKTYESRRNLHWLWSEVKWTEVTRLCLTLCDPMDCSLSGSSVHGIFQAGVLEWIAISFSRASSRPRNRTRVSRIAGRCFTIWATREALHWLYYTNKYIIFHRKPSVYPYARFKVRDF